MLSMDHHYSLENLHLSNTWVTIGSFDGVHIGHQSIIAQMVSAAHTDRAQAVVITFHPHPVEVLRGDQGPFYLTTPEERADLLANLGVDATVTLKFDNTLSALDADEFIADISSHLGLRQLWLGPDFALGHNRQGTIPVLQELGLKYGYEVHVVPIINSEVGKVSSRQIRSYLQEGKVALAARMLGRPYSILGNVVRGDGRGKGIGIPTANLEVWPKRVLPAIGVYATRAYIENQPFPSVTNIGIRPTFENQPVTARIETHLLDFDRDLYGQSIRLEFIDMIRPEKRFPSIEALVRQIHQDIEKTREVLDYGPKTPGLSARPTETVS
jgi:riboflavin kinase / FMN adenylyltransferase